MITMVPRTDIVSVKYNGRQYRMTRDELEAAYRYMCHEIYMDDAAYQLKHLVFGVWGVLDGEIDEAREHGGCDADLMMFEEDYGISYEDAKKHLSAYVARYNANYDTSLTENENWEAAIRYVLNDLAEQRKEA